ncbi:hypothetical protein [Citrobacter freundii]|uniref:hypothetical protein n=1 Tax=Citrobacter freundii TaxID=546 RepID=UPI001FFE0D9D|nr:hypothetical protein [Citrobacter freundii]
MKVLNKHAELRKELSNPAIGSKDHLRKLALSLLDELGAAEKRIAELEARKIALPQRLSPEGYHIDEAYMVDDAEGEYLDRDAVIEAIRAAGIGVKGE